MFYRIHILTHIYGIPRCLHVFKTSAGSVAERSAPDFLPPGFYRTILSRWWWWYPRLLVSSCRHGYDRHRWSYGQSDFIWLPSHVALTVNDKLLRDANLVVMYVIRFMCTQHVKRMNVRGRLCRRLSNNRRPLNRSSVDRSSVVCHTHRSTRWVVHSLIYRLIIIGLCLIFGRNSFPLKQIRNT